ncbi:hypothetical protein RJ640_019689 [Escallonia rubra]|uniref:DYW domain-containing protein n=1 Tax=Escallonia rubra TaxID=112253 RepID=A0AA88RK65_9ASTE|nr:hypothetical protein RJ640_019689 [Escallonia rubra]
MATSIQYSLLNSTSSSPPHPTFEEARKNPPPKFSRFSQKPIKVAQLKGIHQDNFKESFIFLSEKLSQQNSPQSCVNEAYSSLLELCASRNALSQGQQVHAHFLKSAAAYDELAYKALCIFSAMEEADIDHSALVDEGKKYFDKMQNEYNLEPWPQHYACLVDLLGRANYLDEAFQFVKSMQMQPTSAVWCALLGACRIHSNKELGDFAAMKLLELDPANPGNYVLVSNVYAATGRWEDVDVVRRNMKVKGLKKDPACSWIEIMDKVHTFIARDRSHPESGEIYQKLAQITERLETQGGYVADTKHVLHNVDEKEKVKMLYGHSERLAMAYGLLKTPKGIPIRITKNLRVCDDCHTYSKLVSKFFEREIIVRDAKRFHHFCSGVCSCGDFW